MMSAAERSPRWDSSRALREDLRLFISHTLSFRREIKSSVPNTNDTNFGIMQFYSSAAVYASATMSAAPVLRPVMSWNMHEIYFPQCHIVPMAQAQLSGGPCRVLPETSRTPAPGTFVHKIERGHPNVYPFAHVYGHQQATAMAPAAFFQKASLAIPHHAPPPLTSHTRVPFAPKPQKNVVTKPRSNNNGSKKPIVILVSVKNVESTRGNKSPSIPIKKRHLRADLREQVEMQLAEKCAVEELQRKSDLTNYCAMDAEMVGVGPDGKRSVLARISIVDFKGNVLLDSLVKPEEVVTDYRTFVTGIQESDLVDAPSYSEVRIRVIDIIKDRIVIGHALENDFKVLGIAHPADMVRDTAYVTTLRRKLNRPTHLMPSLKHLVSTCLPPDFSFRKRDVHDPIEDARAPLELFKVFRKEFEKQISDGSWTCSPSFYQAV